jgi:outer membrane lipoprotein LolB
LSFRFFFVFSAIGLGAAGCSSIQVPPSENPAAKQAYETRLGQLQSLDHWSLKGRLAISSGKDGGSGQLSWKRADQLTLMSFRGTFGKGAWQLRADETGARLELADGSVHLADSVNELVLQHVGWKVPVEALAWWVKGLASPGKWDSRSLDEQGHLNQLKQLGWDVEFAQYHAEQGPWLPTKLTARQGDYRVKMVIAEWQLESVEEKVD